MSKESIPQTLKREQVILLELLQEEPLIKKTFFFLCVAFLLFLPVPFSHSPVLQKKPCITDASVTPEKVQCGSVMVINACITDAVGIRNVQVKNFHEKGFDTVNLTLVSGTIYEGVWKGTWLVHDTVSKEYCSQITAYSYSNLCSSTIVSWSDPTWWNLNWNYRRQLGIQNPSTNYQMKLTIGYDSDASDADLNLSGECKIDFGDVRFTNKNNSALLNYWLENKTNGDTAVFWVKTNGEDALNVYYGNPSASSQSNGSNTFLFFDDFLGSSLGSQWTVSANSYTVSGGILRINIGAVGLQNPLAVNLNNGYIVEGRILYHTNVGGYSGTLSGQSSRYTQGSNAGADATSLYMRENGNRNVYRWTGTGSAAGYTCGSGSVFTSVDNIWYILGAQFDASGVVLLRERVAQGTYGCGWVKNINYISLGGFYGGASYDIQDTSYDWVLIRKYDATTPSWSSIGAEEIALPTKPLLTVPSDTTVTRDTTPTFQWTVSQNAGNHTIQISNQSNFSTVLINTSLGPTAETYTPLTSIGEGKWYWRVKANNTQGINISTTWSFIIDTTAPDRPVLVLPIENETSDTNQVVFSWDETFDNTTNSDDVSEISCYQLQISDDNFISLLLDQNTSDNATFASTVTIAGRVQWRIRVWDHAGNPSLFSEIRNLTVFDFIMTVTASSVTVLRGSSGSSTLSIEKEFGENETITLSNEWSGLAPTGVTINISNESGSGDFTSVINFETSSISSTGEFVFDVIATSPTGNKTLSITLRIAGMIFQMSAAPTSFSLTRSDTDESRISVTFQYGTKESVSLSGEWVGTAPTGVTTTFSRIDDLPPFDSHLSISTSNTASSGKYTYKVVASGGGITNWIYISIEIKTNLTLTLQSESSTYEKGQEIQLTGTVDDPNGYMVQQGTAMVTFSINDWDEHINTSIVNGVFSLNYYITFDKFNGTWVVSAIATDILGHTTASPTQISLNVTVPPIYKYYTLSILSPLPGQVYKRGEVVSFTVSVLENETKIRDAMVTIQTPDGVKVMLPEISPGLYSKSYSLEMNSQLGNWSVYVTGSTGENDMFKAGFNYIPITVKPTELSLEIVEPAGMSFETGQEIPLTIKLVYPDGSSVEQGIVSVTKNDGSILMCKKTASGLYTAMYSATDKDIGYISIQISATDAYGNIGAMQGVMLHIIPMQFSSYFVRFWWVTCAMLVGLFVALGYVTRDIFRSLRLRYFNQETLELQRLKKDKAVEYFITGSISRETYDNLIQDYESKLVKIEKGKHILEKKMQKKKK